MIVREAAVANQFYPGNARVLRQNILEYLSLVEVSDDDDSVGESGGGKVKGLIVPHAGYIYSGPVAAYGYHFLKMLPKNVMWKILLLGPSHQIPFDGAAASHEGIWMTPLGKVGVKDIREELGIGNDDDIFQEIPDAHTHEHSLEVQVPFLQIALSSFELYPVVLGRVRPDILAEKLFDFVSREDVIVIASSDLSHYLPYDEALKIDGETLGTIISMNIDQAIERADACGIKGILALMFLAEKFKWKPELLNYQNSGNTAGDKKSVVGYASVLFTK